MNFSNANDVEVVEIKHSYQGYISIMRYHLRYRLFAGVWSEVTIREVLVHPGAVGILLYDPNLQSIIMVEQFRIGAFNANVENSWLLEIVAGLIEPGEQIEQVAARESQEEAGVGILDLKSICRYFPSPGGSSEQFNLFCARVDSNTAAKFCGLAHESEDIKVHVLPVAQAFALVDQGKIYHGPSIIALQWLQLHKAEVDHQWIT